MVTRTRPRHRGLMNELDRFETMLDLHRTGVGEEFTQVTNESKARHLRPVARSIVGSPAGLHGVKVACVKSWSQKWMAAVDAAVEQTRMRGVVGLRCKLGSIQQVVKPVSLFVALHRIEEVRRFLGAPQLGNAVERDHGAFHLIHGSASHHHSAFREVQLSLRDVHALGSGSLAERGNRCAPVSADGQPDLPPDCTVVGCRKFVGGVGPERPQTRRPDLSDCVDQALVIAETTGPVACFFQILANQALEVFELAVGDENGGLGPVVLVTNVEELNARSLSCQAFEGQLDVGEALELHLQAQSVFHSGSLLRFPGDFSRASNLADLALQRRTVLGSIPRSRLRRTVATRSRISIHLGFGDAVKDEMPAQSVTFFRHGSPRSLRCASFYSSFSATLLRSASIVRISVSRTFGRSWMRASLSASLDARVISA